VSLPYLLRTLITNRSYLAAIHEFHPSVELGIHAGGHGFIGGLNGDLFVSAGDPLFYMHHAMLDRVWSIWQSLDFDTRVYRDGLDGTRTMLNCKSSMIHTAFAVLLLTNRCSSAQR
jgi:tyrosinase